MISKKRATHCLQCRYVWNVARVEAFPGAKWRCPRCRWAHVVTRVEHPGDMYITLAFHE